MKNSFKETCINLREKDYTLNEIVEVTGRPKTSVHFHIQKIPLSKKKQEVIRKNSIERMQKYALAKKGKSLRKFKKIDKWSKSNVCLLAHLLFDGEINKRKCVYSNRSVALIEKVAGGIKKIYTYKPVIRTNSHTNVISISYYNVALADHLKEKAYELIVEIVSLPKELKRVFLMSFFDDEGSVYYSIKNNEKRVKGYQYDYDMLLTIEKLLKDFGIKSKVSERFNEIKIAKREDIERFYKEISFSPGVRVNGKRKNSIWKKDLEKREILKVAIDSYQL